MDLSGLPAKSRENIEISLEKETLIVQRSSGKNIVVMSMEQFNELQKEIFLAKNAQEKK